MTRNKIALIVCVAAVSAAGVVVVRTHQWRPRSITLQGTVIRQDADPRKELPIGGAQVTVSDGTTSMSVQSDPSGYFRVTYPMDVWPASKVVLSFRKADYLPVDLSLEIGLRPVTKQLFVARMTPVHPATNESPGVEKPHVVSNIKVRYSMNSQSDVNIGTAVRTFEVVNKGNVACKGQEPCSPEGNWKASRGVLALDAGRGNEFRNVRVSCIAGPCPFTRVDLNGFAAGDRNLNVTALDWSDTATFLIEAEVYRIESSSIVSESYPVVFGRTLNFSVPPTQEGVCLEAELDGTPMVFPLGPELYLSWAECSARADKEEKGATVYRCELKPGYRF